MLKIQQVKRLALQNAQGSRAEGVLRQGRRQLLEGSAAVVGGLRLSAGVAFGALEDSSEGLDLCEDEELSLGRILAYDCL